MCWWFIHVTVKLVSGTTQRSAIEICITNGSSPPETVRCENTFSLWARGCREGNAQSVSLGHLLRPSRGNISKEMTYSQRNKDTRKEITILAKTKQYSQRYNNARKQIRILARTKESSQRNKNARKDKRILAKK